MSIPVVQPDKVQFQQIALADKTINVSEENDCAFQVINMGQTKLSNGTVKLLNEKGKEINSAYIGNIDAGGQFVSNYTLPVTFDKTGDYKLTLVFEYENENIVEETLERLGVDYVDLLYIHQPAGNWLAGYRMLEKAYREGKAKSIGISNFEGKYMEELETKWEIVPQFIQVEAHPYFTQKELRVTLDKYGIKLMSWYPLGHGDTALMNELVFAGLGKKYEKTPAQVILRWHTQMGFVVIPGSKNAEHN